MELELRHLRLVVAVAEQGSVTRAAAALGLTQPALTAQLNRIDRTLGAPVFTRDQRGAHPTALGELLLGRARVLLPAMSSLVEDARRFVAGHEDQAGPVRVGTASTAIGGLFVHRLVAGLDSRVTTTSATSVPRVAEQLAAGAVDVALVGMCGDATPPDVAGVGWWRVSTDPVFVLVHDAHPFARRPAVGLGELRDEVWLGVPGEGCFERCFAAACARAGFAPVEVSEADRAAAVDLVHAGHAVALVQPTFPETTGVTVVPLEGAPLSWSHHVGWREDAPQPPVEHVVDAAVRAHHDAVRRSDPRFVDWLDSAGAGADATTPTTV